MFTEAEYQQALTEILHLVEGEPDRASPEGHRLDALTAIVESYEAPRWGLKPIEAESR
jgi:antitoxin component HigA of HigAB toxin-antitoxin module